MSLMRKKIPWTEQPAYIVDQFDTDNFFGKHCLQAIIPGWGKFERNNNVFAGQIKSVGIRHTFVPNGLGSSIVSTNTLSDFGVWGKAKAIKTSGTGNDFGRFLRSDADFGINFPDPRDLCVVVLVRPEGNGSINTDPRIYSKDIGFGTQDHDLMVGSVGAGNGRARIRINGFTETVLSGLNVQNDSLNMIAGMVVPVGATSAEVQCWHMREDGQSGSNSSASAGAGYTPRDTTTIAIGNNAQQENLFIGEIVAIFAFDCAINNEALLWKLFANPWQIFQPRILWVPSGQTTGGATVVLGQPQVHSFAIMRATNY